MEWSKHFSSVELQCLFEVGERSPDVDGVCAALDSMGLSALSRSFREGQSTSVCRDVVEAMTRRLKTKRYLSVAIEGANRLGPRESGPKEVRVTVTNPTGEDRFASVTLYGHASSNGALQLSLLDVVDEPTKRSR